MRDMALEFGDEWDEEGEDSDSEQALDQLQLGETDEDKNELDVGDGELYASGGTHRIRRSASPRHGVYMSTHNGPATECLMLSYDQLLGNRQMIPTYSSMFM